MRNWRVVLCLLQVDVRPILASRLKGLAKDWVQGLFKNFWTVEVGNWIHHHKFKSRKWIGNTGCIVQENRASCMCFGHYFENWEGRHTLNWKTDLGQVEATVPDVWTKLFQHYFASRPQSCLYSAVKQLKSAVVAGVRASVFVIIRLKIEVFC